MLASPKDTHNVTSAALCPVQLDAVTGALEKAVAVVPEGPAKELLQSNLSQCAAELLSLLVPRADAAADEEGSKEKAAGGRKRAKKATTAAADPASR